MWNMTPLLINTTIQCKLVHIDVRPLRYNLPQLAVAVAFAVEAMRQPAGMTRQHQGGMTRGDTTS